MDFTTKEKKLLQFLLQHKGTFVTSKELADYLSCSDRTVRNHLKIIFKALENEGVTLIAKQGQGYTLEVTDDQTYQEFIRKYDLGEVSFRHSIETDIEDRYTIILNKLLFEQEPILFDNLADELYVSRSTLSHDFKKIRCLLADYDLTIESKANKGVYVVGSERNKRRFIMDYFLGNQFFKSLHRYVQPDFFQNTVQFEELTLIVLEECRGAGLRLSDFVIQNLVVHIALAIQRIKEGFELSAIDWELENAEQERAVARRILQRLQETTQIEFPEQEVDYITLHLLSKSPLPKSGSHGINKNAMRKELLEAFQTLGLEAIYHFSSDFQLIEGVVTHLMTLQIRLATHVQLTNPLLADIKDQYSDSFFLTSEVLHAMPAFEQQSLTDDEIAYVTLHFMAAMERYKEATKFNVLAICATGLGSAQMLRNRLESELGNRIRVVDVVGYYEIDQQKLEGIDFIVSAVDLSNLFFHIPVFTVSVFLKPDEVAKIRTAMDGMSVSVSQRYSTTQTMKQTATANSCFSERHFYRFDCISKKELLHTMVEGLAVEEKASFGESFLSFIEQREQMSSVVFSERIAVPHPIQPVAAYQRVAVALCQQPICWDAEHQQVQLIFLLSPSIYGNEGLAEVTQKIVSLTEDNALQERLLSCKTFIEFMTIWNTIN